MENLLVIHADAAGWERYLESLSRFRRSFLVHKLQRPDEPRIRTLLVQQGYPDSDVCYNPESQILMVTGSM